MKDVIGVILCIIIINSFVIYLAGVFISLEPDITEWGEVGRLMFLFLSLISSIPLSAFALDLKNGVYK